MYARLARGLAIPVYKSSLIIIRLTVAKLLYDNNMLTNKLVVLVRNP